MRSRRTGSRSIRALPPTLPPAISTCARRYVESEYYENRAGIDGAGRHDNHGSVGQAELFLPARENVSKEAPARKTTSARFRTRRCKSEGLQPFTYRRTR